jgi:hypothetical protein
MRFRKPFSVTTVVALIVLAGTLRASAPADVPRGAAGEGPLVLNLKVVEGDGAVHRVGSRSTGPITVQVTDAAGRPVTGVAVSFLMPGHGPAGVFANGLSTEVLTTGTDGRASVKGIRWGRASGAVRIRVTAMRGRSRAGTLTTQYLNDSDKASGKKTGRGPSVSKPRGKWLAIAVIAAGAAAGGLALGLSGGGTGGSGSTPASSAVADGPAVQVGAPSITIGAP